MRSFPYGGMDNVFPLEQLMVFFVSGPLHTETIRLALRYPTYFVADIPMSSYKLESYGVQVSTQRMIDICGPSLMKNLNEMSSIAPHDPEAAFMRLSEDQVRVIAEGLDIKTLPKIEEEDDYSALVLPRKRTEQHDTLFDRMMGLCGRTGVGAEMPVDAFLEFCKAYAYVRGMDQFMSNSILRDSLEAYSIRHQIPVSVVRGSRTVTGALLTAERLPGSIARQINLLIHRNKDVTHVDLNVVLATAMIDSTGAASTEDQPSVESIKLKAPKRPIGRPRKS